jgi:hypothetical protein
MTPELFIMSFSFVLNVISAYVIVKKDDRVNDLKISNQALFEQIKYMGKTFDEQKVRSFSRSDFSLKQAMIQKTQADIAERLQTYLSCEGMHSADT